MEVAITLTAPSWADRSQVSTYTYGAEKRGGLYVYLFYNGVPSPTPMNWWLVLNQGLDCPSR